MQSPALSPILGVLMLLGAMIFAGFILPGMVYAGSVSMAMPLAILGFLLSAFTLGAGVWHNKLRLEPSWQPTVGAVLGVIDAASWLVLIMYVPTVISLAG